MWCTIRSAIRILSSAGYSMIPYEIDIEDGEVLEALLNSVSNVEFNGQPSYFIESDEKGIEIELYEPSGSRLCIPYHMMESWTICGDEEFIFIRVIS